MANREEILKQTQRFRHTLDAMEHVIKTGNTRGARGADPQRQRRTRRLADERSDAAHAPLIRDDARARRHVHHPLPRPAAAARRRRHGARCPAPRASPTACCCSPRCAAGTTTIHDLLDSDDTRVMLEALRALGCGVERTPARRSRSRASAAAARAAASTLFLGNAGTAMRPLTAALALSATASALRAARRRRACTSGRSATSSTRCARSAARSTTSAAPAIRRCVMRAAPRARARRADPRARRRVEPVPHRAAAGAAAASPQRRHRRSRSKAS